MRFHILLKELKIEHAKQDMLIPYNVISTKELNETQLDELINALEQQKVKAKKDTPREIRIKRHQVLNLLASIGIENKGDQQTYWARVNRYLSNKRIAGKLLYEMTEQELDKCIKKLHMVKREVDRRLQEEKFWASNN